MPTERPRFTIGLTIDVAAAIEAHGYDLVAGPDHVALQQHLFGFLYGTDGSGCAGGRCAHADANRRREDQRRAD